VIHLNWLYTIETVNHSLNCNVKKITCGLKSGGVQLAVNCSENDSNNIVPLWHYRYSCGVAFLIIWQ